MGNINNSNQYHNIRYLALYDNEIQYIRTNYKVVDVDWFESIICKFCSR